MGLWRTGDNELSFERNEREREQETYRENLGKDFAMKMYEQVCVWMNEMNGSVIVAKQWGFMSNEHEFWTNTMRRHDTLDKNNATE